MITEEVPNQRDELMSTKGNLIFNSSHLIDNIVDSLYSGTFLNRHSKKQTTSMQQTKSVHISYTANNYITDLGNRRDTFLLWTTDTPKYYLQYKFTSKNEPMALPHEYCTDTITFFKLFSCDSHSLQKSAFCYTTFHSIPVCGMKVMPTPETKPQAHVIEWKTTQ